MVIICGIDDAGKGPVIGAMIVAGILIDKEDLSKLVKIGVKDSKLLTQKQREKLCPQIIKIVKSCKVIKISPSEVDRAVFSDKGFNLNWLEGEKMAEVINYLKPDEVIIDCPSPNIKAFKHFLDSKIKIPVSLLCEHKAERHPQVAAASILAKCAREEEVLLLKEKIGVDFGSGYAADPKTKEFLKENWNKYPEIFRHSWAPYKEYSEGKKSRKQKSLEEY